MTSERGDESSWATICVQKSNNDCRIALTWAPEGHRRWGRQDIRELKHRRFWAMDGNRKANVVGFGALLPPTKELENPCFCIQNLTLRIKSRWYAPKQRTFEFRFPSVAQKRLCLLSSLMWRTSEKDKERAGWKSWSEVGTAAAADRAGWRPSIEVLGPVYMEGGWPRYQGHPPSRATLGGPTCHTFLYKAHWSVYMIDRVTRLNPGHLSACQGHPPRRTIFSACKRSPQGHPPRQAISVDLKTRERAAEGREPARKEAGRLWEVGKERLGSEIPKMARTGRNRKNFHNIV